MSNVLECRLVDPADAQPGDAIIVQGKALLDRVIWLAQRLRWRDARYTHAALITEIRPDGTIVACEMEYPAFKWTTYQELAAGAKCAIVRAPDGIDRQRVVRYARGRAGTKYGLLTLLSILVTLLTPKWFRIDFRRTGTLICSALVAVSWTVGGWWAFSDPYQITPCELGAWGNVPE